MQRDLDIAMRDLAPCPEHEGHFWHKSGGFCSCGSNHSLLDPPVAFEFEVQGYYGSGWECVDTHDTKAEADRSKDTYDANESYPHRVRRVRITES